MNRQETKAQIEGAQAVLDRLASKGVSYVHLSRTDKRDYAQALNAVKKYTNYIKTMEL